MQQFKRSLSVDELQAACAAAGFPFNRDRYDRGDDHVSFEGVFAGVPCRVIYSGFNGRYFGETITGERFLSDEEKDDVPYFAALLRFCHVDPIPDPVGETQGQIHG